jgi:DNA mismatch endonuclease, patch repair protein
MDVHSKETRSLNMSRIKSKNSKIELFVRKFLFKNGFRYRIHDKKIIGTPDIVLPKYQVIVDVRGCYWHGHENCKYGDKVTPDSVTAQKRIKDAKIRDKRNIREWKKLGWNIIIVWGRCELEDKKKSFSEKRDKRLKKLKQEILNSTSNE